MRYKIIDSHRTWTEDKKSKLLHFFMEAKNINCDEAQKQVDFTKWYRTETTSICFEAIAYDNGNVVGYMRCFNDPEDKGRWFVGDIHVLEPYRQKKIASKLYEKVINEVEEYEGAECIEASIRADNTASVGLHKSFGFYDTRARKKFYDFYFDETETFYRYDIYRYYPVPYVDGVEDKLAPIWNKYLAGDANKNNKFSSMSVVELVERGIIDGEFFVESVWQGNNLVGLCLSDEEEVLLYIE